MADVDGAWSADTAIGGAGVLGRLARGQYAALAVLRLRLFVNGFRTVAGAFELSARTVSFFIYCLMGLGLGTGAAIAAYTEVALHRWEELSIEFWVLDVLWIAIAVALASFQEQYDLSKLLQFPVSFKSFFLLYLIFGFVDISTIMGGLCCLGILVAIAFARTGLVVIALAALAGFAAFNILLVRAVLAWIDRWLAKRRSRELVSAFFLIAMLSLQLLNPVVRNQTRPKHSRHRDWQETHETFLWVKAVESVQAWLPPGLTMAILRSTDEHDPVAAAELLGALGIYVLGAGALLGVRLRAEYRGENLGESPGRKSREASRSKRLIGGSGPIGAQIEKEVRTIVRSMPQLYSVVVPMLMVFVIASLFRGGVALPRHSFQMALPVCVAYGLLGFTQLMYNNLGGEGTGIQMFFLFPVPMRTILLGKNLFHAALYVLVALGAGILASMRLGHPSGGTMATTLAWVAFALPANLAAGNMLSLTMAYRVNLGRIGRQSGSQGNALLSMLIQTTILGVGAGVVGLSGFFGKPWLAATVLCILACGAVVAWMLVLRNADRIANLHRDTLIAKLARIE
jgi:ABC-2 type transport system permease protein